MKVKMILPALTEALSPYWRPIKYSLFPPLGLATLAAYLDEDDDVTIGQRGPTWPWAGFTSPHCPRKPLATPIPSSWAPARIPGQLFWPITAPGGPARSINHRRVAW